MRKLFAIAIVVLTSLFATTAMAQSSREVFTICAGETVTFPTPKFGPGGPGACSPALTDVRIEEPATILSIDAAGFTLQPEVGFYTVVGKGSCSYLDPTTGLSRIFNSEVRWRYEVKLAAGCQETEQNSPLFEDFPWLTDLVDRTNCTTEKVELYKSGIYSYLLVTEADGTAKLYNQDGAFYCQNANNFDCPTAYNFGPPIRPATWECSGGNTSVCDDEQAISNYSGSGFGSCNTVTSIERIDYLGNTYYRTNLGPTLSSAVSNPFPCGVQENFGATYDCEGKKICEFALSAPPPDYDPVLCAALNTAERTTIWRHPDLVCDLENPLELTSLQRVLNEDRYLLAGGDTCQQLEDITEVFYLGTRLFRVTYSTYNNAPCGTVPNRSFFYDCQGQERPICSNPTLCTNLSTSSGRFLWQREPRPELLLTSEFDQYDVIYSICKGDTIDIPNPDRAISCEGVPGVDFQRSTWTSTTGTGVGTFPANGQPDRRLRFFPTQTTAFEGIFSELACGANVVPSGNPLRYLVLVEENENCSSNDIPYFLVEACVGDTLDLPFPNHPGLEDPAVCQNWPTISDTTAIRFIEFKEKFLRVVVKQAGEFRPFRFGGRGTGEGQNIRVSLTCPSIGYEYNITLKSDCQQPNCVCPTDLPGPVCGTDGKTYDNECKARCAGVATAFMGACDPEITGCFISITNNECRTIGVYDEADNLLATMGSGPFPNMPINTPASIWTDTRSLANNATRTYIFKENNLILGRQTATCTNTNIAVVSNQFSGCTDALFTARITNTGCRTLQVFNTSGNVITTAAPEEIITLTTGSEIYIFVAGGDTLSVNTNAGESIDTKGCTNNNNNALFEEYAWLLDLIDPNNCTTEKITVYQQGIYSYLLVTDASGDTKMYNQDGQFYCQNSATYDCVAAYNLGSPIDSWTCSGTSSGACLTDEEIIQKLRASDFGEACPTTKITKIEYNGNLYYTYTIGSDPNSNTPCTLQDFGGATVNCRGESICVYSIFFDDPPICNELNNGVKTEIWSLDNTNTPPMFTTYPWLLDLVDPNNCNIDGISVYQQGIYSYLLVADKEGGAILYNQDGQLYCRNSSNYDCVAAYNLTGNLTDFWICNPGQICAQVEVCGIDGKIYPTPCDAAEAGVEASPDLSPCQQNMQCNFNYEGIVTVSICGGQSNDPILQLEDGRFIAAAFSGSANFTGQAGDQLRVRMEIDIKEDQMVNCTVPAIIGLITCFEVIESLDQCTITLSSRNCRIIGIYDTADNLLTTLDPGFVPAITVPLETWQDPNPLAVGATRTYIFKEGNFEVGRQTASCDNTNIDVRLNYPSGCSDAAGVHILTNTGCRDLNSFNTSGNLLDTAAPGETLRLGSNTIHILMAGSDTLGVEVAFGFNERDVDTGGCGGSNDAIFNDYPWLTDLVNPTNCNTEKVEVYQQSIYTYLLVTDATGDTKLYNQDGLFYCQNSSNYDCVAAYNLGAPIDTWTCDASGSASCTNVVVELQGDQLIIQEDPLSFFAIRPEISGLINVSFSEIGPGGGSFVDSQCSGQNCSLPVTIAGGGGGVDRYTVRFNLQDGTSCSYTVETPKPQDCLDDTDIIGMRLNRETADCKVAKIDKIEYNGNIFYEYILGVTENCVVNDIGLVDCLGQTPCGNNGNSPLCTNLNLGTRTEIWSDDMPPTEGCTITITNNECDVVGLYDENDNLLISMFSKFQVPNPGNPNPIPMNIWEDTRPLPSGEERQYIFKIGDFVIGSQIASCSNTAISTVNNFYDATESNCFGGGSSQILTNTGCRTLEAISVQEGFVRTAPPGGTLVLNATSTFPIYILKAGADTLGIFTEFPDENIDTGGCTEGACSGEEGTIFFQNCDNGQLYYFVRTADGRVYDPYFDASITYEPVDGQRIRFNFVDASFPTPCSTAEKAITITCLEVVESGGGNAAFEKYPFLEEEVDLYGCNAIEIFDQGSYAFVFLRLSPNSGRLYLDNGTFYCESTPTYDCLSAYGLGAPSNDYSCSNLDTSESEERSARSVAPINFTAFPNPTTGLLTIQLPADKKAYQLTLHDMLGRTVQQTTVAPGTTSVELNLADQDNGVYYIELRAAGVRGIQKVVKQGLE